MTDTNSEEQAFTRDLFATNSQDFVRNLIVAAPEPAARAVVPAEGGNPRPRTRTPQEQESRQFMAHLLGTPDRDNLPDYL